MGAASLRRFSLLRGGAQHPPGLLWLPRPEAAGATKFARKVARRDGGLARLPQRVVNQVIGRFQLDLDAVPLPCQRPRHDDVVLDPRGGEPKDAGRSLQLWVEVRID